MSSTQAGVVGVQHCVVHFLCLRDGHCPVNNHLVIELVTGQALTDHWNNVPTVLLF